VHRTIHSGFLLIAQFVRRFVVWVTNLRVGQMYRNLETRRAHLYYLM